MAGFVNRVMKWVTGRGSAEPSLPSPSVEGSGKFMGYVKHGPELDPWSTGVMGCSNSGIESWSELGFFRDKETRSAGQELSNEQLLKVAGTLGQKWEHVAFHLGLKTKDLDDINAAHMTVAMRKYKMLQLWQCRRPGKATAQDLLRGLEDLEDLPVETCRLLKEYLYAKKDLECRPSLPLSNDSGSESMPDSELDSGSESMSESELFMDGMHARDNETRSTGRDLTDEELLKVAQTLGKEWEQAAVHLELKTKDLDDIKAEERNVAMQKYKMLRLWQHRRPGKATAQDLLRGLEDLEALPLQLLTGLNHLINNQSKFVKKKSSCSSGSSLGAMSSALPLKMPKSDAGGALGELQRIRSEFVQKVSKKVIKVLLDDLLEYEVLSTEEKDSVMEEQRNKKDMARCLINMVIGKQEQGASWIMIYSIKERDPDLYSTLGLISSPAGVEHVTNQIDGPSSPGSSGQGSLSDFELSDTLVGPVQEKTPDPERTDVDVNATGNGSDVDINNVNPPVPQTGLGWNHIKSIFLKKQSFSTRQGCLFGVVYEAPHRRIPNSDGTLGRKIWKNHIPEDGSDSDNEDDEDEEEMHFKSQCEKCKAAQQSPEYEKVTPRKISKWSFEVQLEGKGTYECSVTGLVFEVSEQALVRYSVLSWFKFSGFLKDSWRPAGSIYDVDVVNKDPSVLKFIHFPHSLCLPEPEHDLSFSVLHVKERHADIESTVDFTASHVKWRVSSLSEVGPIIPSSLQVKHHGLVLVYKERNKYQQFIFYVFLASNNVSEIQAIEEQVLSSHKILIKIDKSATCRLEEKFHCLTSEPKGQIEPRKLEFVTKLLACKGFFEVRFGEGPPFELFLKDSDCDEPLWSATIREEDWKFVKKPSVHKKKTRVANIRPRGEQSQGRKSSPSDSNNKTRTAGQALTERQLLKVAETLGQEWEQAAIHLELKSKDLDDIKAEHRSVTMQKQKMLLLWTRRRPPGKATAKDLLEGLKDMEDLPVETRRLLTE